MKEIIATNAAPAAIGPYAQGTAGAGIVITSGSSSTLMILLISLLSISRHLGST